MKIDPKIIAQMNKAVTEPPQDDGLPVQQRGLGFVDPEGMETSRGNEPVTICKKRGKDTRGMPFHTCDRSDNLPPLRGTEKQVMWAVTIRENALFYTWKPEIEAKLRSIVDATWWIVNRNDLPKLKFKEPSPQQTAGAEISPKLAKDLNTLAGEAHPNAAPLARPEGKTSPEIQQHFDTRQRVTDAQEWARSVSQHSKLAEAAILAVMSRLYKEPDMRSRLRLAAKDVLDEAEQIVEKDTEAIRKMLT